MSPVSSTDWYRSIAVELADTTVTLPCDGRIGTHQSMVFPLTSYDDVYPGAAVHCVGIFYA